MDEGALTGGDGGGQCGRPGGLVVVGQGARFLPDGPEFLEDAVEVKDEGGAVAIT